MTPLAAASEAMPEALERLLAGRSDVEARRVRGVARAWQAGGGSLEVGKLTVRLVAGERPFTAATLHLAAGSGARLEVARPSLAAHGFGAVAWQQWLDERPELAVAGPTNFPTFPLAALEDLAAARLAVGMRDIALRLTRRDRAA